MKRLFALVAAPALAGGIGAATAADVAPYDRAPVNGGDDGPAATESVAPARPPPPPVLAASQPAARHARRPGRATAPPRRLFPAAATYQSGPVLCPAPPCAAPVVVPYYNWNGFYVGANVGGAWSNNDALWSPLPASAVFGFFPIANNTGGSSAIGGFQAGYNWQFTPTWVVGLEGDWSWAKTGGSFSQPWVSNPGSVALPGSFTTMGSTMDWVSSLRARLGYLVLPNLMAYGTVGGAWGKVDYTASNFGPGAPPYATSTSFSNTQGGWVAGGGLEWMITNNWQLRGEYLYYSLNSSPSTVRGAANYLAIPSGYSWSSTNASVARADLSYKF
jgi:outer membrane immunogenic protein